MKRIIACFAFENNNWSNINIERRNSSSSSSNSNNVNNIINNSNANNKNNNKNNNTSNKNSVRRNNNCSSSSNENSDRAATATTATATTTATTTKPWNPNIGEPSPAENAAKQRKWARSFRLLAWLSTQRSRLRREENIGRRSNNFVPTGASKHLMAGCKKFTSGLRIMPLLLPLATVNNRYGGNNQGGF